MDEDDCGKIVGTCCPCHVLLLVAGTSAYPAPRSPSGRQVRSAQWPERRPQFDGYQVPVAWTASSISFTVGGVG